MNHTEKPWFRQVFGSHIRIVDDEGNDIAVFGDFRDEKVQANIEHALTCVNSHDELVMALRESQALLGSTGGPTRVECVGMVKRIQGALKAAGVQ